LSRAQVHDTFTAPEARKNMVAPLKREGTPEEIGVAVLFLVSDMASFVTDDTLNINGRQRMG